MAYEVGVEHDVGLELYYQIRHLDGKVRDVVNGDWDTYAVADWANYVDDGGDNDLHFTEVGENSGIYRATFPVLDPGIYFLRLFEQAGENPASTDERIGDQGKMVWNGFAEIDASSIANTWFVSKAGANTNTGVNWANALLTIGAAVAVATSNDTILIGPGIYTEAVDLITATKALKIQGAGAARCILTQGAVTNTLELYSGSTLRDMTVSSTDDPGGVGVDLQAQTDVLIEDCIITGNFDGLNVGTSDRLVMRRCKVLATYDGANFVSATRFLIEDTLFSTDCTVATTAARAMIVTGADAIGVFRNCRFSAIRTDAQDWDVIAVTVGGRIWLDHCNIYAEITNAGGDGDVMGIDEQYGLAKDLLVTSSKIITSSAGGGTVKDIIQTGGAFSLVDTLYDSTKVTGTIADLTRNSILDDNTRFSGANIAAILGYTDLIDDVANGLAAIKAEVEGLAGEAMRGTDGANTTIPDAAGTAPTAAQIDTELTSNHGSGLWTSDLGTGPNLRPYTVTVNGQPLADCRIWITNDRAGVVTPLVASGYTNSSGVFSFRHSFAAGTRLYVWRQKSGYNFVNPDVEVI